MSNRLIQRVAILAVILIVATVAGYFNIDLDGEGVQQSGSGGGQSPNAKSARAALEELEVAPVGSMAGYSREEFDHWSSADEFGWDVPQESCDARDAALIRDGKDVQVGESCSVESGKWLDPFTGATFTDPSDIDIDHMVPLANAWRSGASEWDAVERENFANAPDVLLSVEDNANQSKGDKGPEAWKPPNQSEWCDYAARWTLIKSDYALTINPQEKETLTQMLENCDTK